MGNKVAQIGAHTSAVLYDNGIAKVVMNRRLNRITLTDPEGDCVIEDELIGRVGVDVFSMWDQERWKSIMYGKPSSFSLSSQVNALLEHAKKQYNSTLGGVTANALAALESYCNDLLGESIDDLTFTVEIWPNMEQNVVNASLNDGNGLQPHDMISIRRVLSSCPVALGHDKDDEDEYARVWEQPINSLSAGNLLVMAV